MSELVPPAAVAAAAKKGLALREKFGRGGTEVGVKRAEGLAARRAIRDDDVGHIASYFARHEVDKEAKAHDWGDESDPSAGYIAWLLWGGEPGRAWVEKLKAKRDA